MNRIQNSLSTLKKTLLVLIYPFVLLLMGCSREVRPAYYMGPSPDLKITKANTNITVTLPPEESKHDEILYKRFEER